MYSTLILFAFRLGRWSRYWYTWWSNNWSRWQCQGHLWLSRSSKCTQLLVAAARPPSVLSGTGRVFMLAALHVVDEHWLKYRFFFLYESFPDCIQISFIENAVLRVPVAKLHCRARNIVNCSRRETCWIWPTFSCQILACTYAKLRALLTRRTSMKRHPRPPRACQ